MAFLACDRPPVPDTNSRELLLAAPVAGVVAGAPMRLEVDAWRNFQPLTPERGPPLLAVLRLTSDRPIPAGLVIESVALVRGDQVWTGTARQEVAAEAQAPVVEFMLREGPQWSPGDTIEVVARLREASGAISWLRAPHVVVQRVE